MSSSRRDARGPGAEGAISSGITMNFTNAATNAGRDVGSRNKIRVINNYHVSRDKVYSSLEIAHWLRSPSVNYRTIQEETRGLRTPETIRWFFDLQDYIDWVEGGTGGPRHLTCIGMPGAGKTILASAIIEDLERRFHPSSSKSRSVLYIYFKHDRQSIQTGPIVLANLLSQIVQMQDPPSDSVKELYKAYETDLTVIPGPDKLMAMLKSEIPANTTIYIVIDALDEFVRNDRDLSSALELIRELEKLSVKLLITSRYDFTFKHEPAFKIKVSASEADLKAFIEEKMSRSARLEKFIERSPGLKSEIITQIVEKSQGMFLITRFLMDWICDLLKLGQVRDALRSLPSGTDAMYELTMTRVGDQRDDLKKLALHALSWVLLAKRRLRMKELQHALAFELHESDGMVNNDDLYELEDIISACMGLITCVDGEIQFVHFSTQEFLSDHCDKYFPDARLRVVESCLQYLIIVTPLVPDDLRNVEDSYNKATEYFLPFPFANYASSHWGLHASDIDSHELLNVDLVDQFFSHPLSPYLASANFPYPRITQTEEMSTVIYKTLFFSIFGLCSLLKRCIESAIAQCEESTAVDLNDVRDRDGHTPLYFATAHNRPTTVQLLLNAGADATVADASNSTCLHKAASDGRLNIITMLLQHGVVVDARDNYGESAIFDAVWENKLEAIELLYENGADISISNKNGQTLLHRATYRGLSDIANTLLEKGMEINSLDGDGRTPIWIAVNGRKRVMVRLLIEKGANISIPSKSGQTFLHRAAYHGLLDITTILLEKGMEIDSLDDDGRSPIWIAVDERERKMVRLLIEKGADIRIPSKNGQTVLHRAAYQGLSDIVTILLNDHGFNVNQQDDEGRTSIVLAAEGGHPDVIQLLLAQGADASLTNHNGETALHVAALNNETDAVIALTLDPDVDTDAKDVSGRTTLLTAMEHGSFSAAAVLIENGASTTDFATQHFPSENLNDLLRWAAYHGCTRAVELLMTMGADLGGTDDDGLGDDVIAFAAAGHALEALKLLLRQGCVDIDKPNHQQQAPIHRAIDPWRTRKDVLDSERAAVVRILLERGADIHRVDKSSDTPLSQARKCEWPEIRELVEQHAIRLQSEADIQDEGAVVDGVVRDGGREEEPLSHPIHDQDDKGDRDMDEGDIEGASEGGDSQQVEEAEQETEAVMAETTEVDVNDGDGRMADGRIGLALEDAEPGRNLGEGVGKVESRTEEGPKEANDTADDDERQTEPSIVLEEPALERRERRFSLESILNVILIVIIAILAYIV